MDKFKKNAYIVIIRCLFLIRIDQMQLNLLIAQFDMGLRSIDHTPIAAISYWSIIDHTSIASTSY